MSRVDCAYILIAATIACEIAVVICSRRFTRYRREIRRGRGNAKPVWTSAPRWAVLDPALPHHPKGPPPADRAPAAQST